MTVPKLYKGSTQISPFAIALQPYLFYSPRTSTSDAGMPMVTVSPGGTATTKGSWVELVASTSETADWITLYTTGGGIISQANGMLWDIGVGASGSETVLVGDIAVGYAPGADPLKPCAVDVPVAVAAGTRIAVRYQGKQTSASALAQVQLARYPTSSGARSPSSIDTIGADTANTAGVLLSGSANVWTQVTASTARAYRGVVLTITSNDYKMVGTFEAFDLGIGASGSEVPYLCGKIWTPSASETLTHGNQGGSSFIPVDIPAGSRLAVRMIGNSAGNNTGYSAVLLGVPA